VYVAFTCICVLGVAILLKAASIQMKEGEDLRRQAFNMHMRTDTMFAERGNIYTEDGHLLCSSIPQFDIHLDFTVIKPDTFHKYIDTLARAISTILPAKSLGTYKAELMKAFHDSSRYYFLAKNVPYDRYLALRSLPIFKKGKRNGGFIAETKIKRVNPYGMLAFRTIGLWRQNARAVGLEATYDSLLQGENGHRVVQKMTGGVEVPIEGSETDPQNGYDIVSTLDLGIQNVAEHALMSVLQQYECLNGTVIVMEVQTGKIRALVNLGRDNETGRYFENQNYAMTPAEPGSTFKLMTLLSLLNDGYINVDDMVNCHGGSFQFGNRLMKDSHFGAGTMPIWEAYAHSSNVGMGWLAYNYYYKNPEKYIKHLEEFGIDQRTGIDLSGELQPQMIKPGSKHWNSTTLPWMATGYGILITPLRTCMMYNAIANGGKLMKPYLISSIQEYGKEIRKFEPAVLNEHIGDSSTIAQLQKCTREVVLSGTGHHIMSPHYGIAGKTGTAQVADKIGGRWYGYKDGVYQGSFVGYFPTDKPRYTMMVMIRTKPHSGAYYGGTIAAPVFRMISDKIFATGMGSWGGPLDSIAQYSPKQLYARQATGASYQLLLQSLGLKVKAGAARKTSIAQLSLDSNKNLSLKEKPVIKGTVPDVTGMGLRDAVYLLENAGLHVQIQGSGTVQVQSIAPGVPAIKGQSITLQLS
jgi:cell division protein FtsI (penicillin-binding protein 3)